VSSVLFLILCKATIGEASLDQIFLEQDGCDRCKEDLDEEVQAIVEASHVTQRLPEAQPDPRLHLHGWVQLEIVFIVEVSVVDLQLSRGYLQVRHAVSYGVKRVENGIMHFYLVDLDS